ncbi:unnamed protein product [Prunus armeniaca]|uniref:USP domain-containing protein n=1 Tax=Prunus armeniaca TaxID=36596 RepID=A0A6J5XAJ1_PRUAR|nr:unnamed protein product [Prunus armeniaca]
MSLLQKQSPGKAEKHVEKNVLQFGSIYFGTIISSGECNGESSRPQNSVNGLSKVQPLSSLNKHNEVEAVKAASDSLPASLTTLTERNLCFLNATLRALLSCSPFVQLLQELRTRKVPKVGYPTLGAFAEFVSEFDMPSGSSSKNKDASVLETGRPFSPTMFEGILKIFTLDVPTSISGRPRFVFDLGQ